MASETEKLKRIWENAKRIWNAVKPIKNAAEDVLDPLQQLFQARITRDELAHASPPLLDCVRVGLAFKAYTDRFRAPGCNRWKSSADLIEEFTDAGLGRTADNILALGKLKNLQNFLEQLKIMAASASDLTGAIYGVLFLTQPDFVIRYANTSARIKADNDFRGTRADAEMILPNVKQAVMDTEAMMRAKSVRK